MFTHIHHVNLLVRDLDRAMARYRDLLAIDSFEVADLPARGVRTARFRVGESWLVLVQPTDPDGVPGRHLAEHGEGLFLLSLGVESLASATRTISSRGGRFTADAPRDGLDGWRIIDLETEQFFGITLQICEEN